MNPSHDKSLQDDLSDRVFMAMEKKDQAALKDALLALVQAILNEDDET